MSSNPGGPDLRRIAESPDAFEAFYREHLDAIHRFVARRVADPHHASDLVADIFLAAIDAAGGLASPTRRTQMVVGSGWLRSKTAEASESGRARAGANAGGPDQTVRAFST